MKRFLLFAVLGFVNPAVGRDGPKSDRFEYRTPTGLSYIVTPDGLSDVRLGERVLAHGGWQLKIADVNWGLKPNPLATAIVAKTIEVVSPTEVRVTHQYAQLTARHTFRFAGEDVRIDSWIENRHPTAAIEVPALTGPTVHFGRTPRGILPNWFWTYTAAGGLPLMHPGGIRIGGSYGIGDGFGVGLAPHSAGKFSTAALWEWDWAPGKREADPNRTPTVFVHAPIPAGGARTIAVTLRFSTNTEWTHLLDPYRRHLHATFGEKPLYDRPSQMPIVQGVVNGAENQRSPANPYCYEPSRRLDTVNGIITYHARLAPDMRAIPAQGLLVWGQGGLNARGAMYRPDFDVLPPEVAANIPRFAGLFKEHGMTFGVTARPRQIVQPFNWTTDTVGSVNPANSGDLALLTHRFNNMIALGATTFYLDSFGNLIDDVTIARAIRTGVDKEPGVGRSAQFYAEHPSDVILPYSGMLLALNGSAADNTLGIFFSGDFWLNPPDTPKITDVMRYFYPDVPVIVLIASAQGMDTVARKRTAVEFCYKLRATPLIEDNWLGPATGLADWLAPLTRQYLTADGQWK
jgi:hypothetical protein